MAREAAGADLGPATAGGAPGITATLLHRGEWTMIILSNLDRGIIGQVETQLQEWLGGVKE